jgi:hypothetical protein
MNHASWRRGLRTIRSFGTRFGRCSTWSGPRSFPGSLRSADPATETLDSIGVFSGADPDSAVQPVRGWHRDQEEGPSHDGGRGLTRGPTGRYVSRAHQACASARRSISPARVPATSREGAARPGSGRDRGRSPGCIDQAEPAGGTVGRERGVRASVRPLRPRVWRAFDAIWSRIAAP